MSELGQIYVDHPERLRQLRNKLSIISIIQYNQAADPIR